MRKKSVGTNLKNFDAVLCNGGSLLAEEMIYLLQVGVDGNVVLVICRERQGWREPQKDRHSIVHDELRV